MTNANDRRLILKPCPCCGGQATVVKASGRSVLHTPYWSGYVKCKSCKLSTPMLKSPGAVERVWNRRAPIIAETAKGITP